MKHSGSLLIEIILGVLLVAVIFGIATLQLGKNTVQRQRQELEMAARHFILDCRFVQQKNMFASSADRLDIVPSWGTGKYHFVKKLLSSDPCQLVAIFCFEISTTASLKLLQPKSPHL